MSHDKSKPIDIVYTWVDGNNSSYRDLSARYAGRAGDLNPERYRDQYTLLKYSLRSLERYVSWYGTICIVTQRPQKPDWLDTSHPRIRIIHHDEIIDPQYLPTFNSNVIESCIHRIPGISDYFLYMNDDFLFGRPVAVEDFITDDGRIRIIGTIMGERLRFRIYDTRWNIISYGFIEHTPLFIWKEAWEAMVDGMQEEIHRTRLNRFRTDYDLAMDKLYRYYMLSRRKDRSQAISACDALRYHRFHKITNNRGKQTKGLDRLRTMKPKFYCLNDDQRNHPDGGVVAMVKNFLEEYYPAPSSFEKQGQEE